MKDLLLLWSAIVSLFGIIIGYFLLYYFEKKKEFISKNTAIKRNAYKEFADIVVELFKTIKIIDDDARKKEINRIVEKLFDFHKKFLLYASPDLVIAFGEFMQHLYIQDKAKDNKETLILLSKVIKAMRSDLYLSNKGLGNYGEKIFRPLLKDFDNIFK